MKKALIIISLLILGTGGYFSYTYWTEKNPENLWLLVPESAVAVYENERLIQTWNELKEISTWKNISQIKTIGKLDSNLAFLDSLMGGGRLEALTNSNPVLISLHITAKDDFDFLFQLEVPNIESHASVWQAIDNLEEAGYITSKRTYQGHTLSEIRKDDVVFTYIFYNNFLIGSFTPFLVEDVIRTLDDPDLKSFASNHPGLFPLIKLQNDAGNIYINSDKIDDLAGIFTSNSQAQTNLLDQFAWSTFLDISFRENDILMNGFTLTSAEKPSFLSTFEGNPARTFELAKLVPQNAAILYHLSFENTLAWRDQLKSYHSEKIKAIKTKIRLEHDIDPDGYFNWIGNEISLAILESPDIQNPDKLIFIETNDPSEALKHLNRLAQVSIGPDDSLYNENYDDVQITQIHLTDFPQALFGPLFNDFEDSFFMMSNEFVILSNHVQALKGWYDQFRNDNTWGKSVRMNQFLDASLKEANFSLFINTNRSWQILQHKLTPEWQRFVQENSGVFRRFEMVACQFSYIDKKYYTSISLHQPENQLVSSSGYREIQSIEFVAPIASKPFVVRNHENREFEVLLQDTLNNLYLVNPRGQVLWTKELSGAIISNVHQIDFYKNGKLQYLIATPDHIHVIDRKGNYVSPYPLQLSPDIKLEYINLVDYDKSRNYRIMAVEDNGNLFLYDKNGKNLAGWTPRELNGPLAFPAFHQRIRNRDRIIAIQRSGIVNVIVRSGQMSKGFPIDLKAETHSQAFLQVGSNFSNTKITTITKDGELVEFNLEGEILNRDQLYKPDPKTTFFTLPDVLGKSLLLIRKTGNRLAVLDRSGQVLFEKDYLSGSGLEWLYYNFGATKEIIVILDKEQEFAYLYNRTGQLVNFQPLKSSQQIALIYFDNENNFQLHKVFRNQYSVLEFSY